VVRNFRYGSGKYAVDTCNCEPLLKDFGSNNAEEDTNDVKQMGLSSCLFLSHLI
jgi:hypothetical protein